MSVLVGISFIVINTLFQIIQGVNKCLYAKSSEQGRDVVTMDD